MSTTYNDLVQNLQDWLEDDDSEFTGSIPEIIHLGELRLWRDLDLAIFSSQSTVNTAVNSGVLVKPTTDPNLVSFTQLYYDDGDRRYWLELRSSDYVRDMQTPSSLGRPKYYAEESSAAWLVAPLPNAIYDVNCRGTTRPTQLSTGTQSTWLSTHQEDLLLKACLAEAEKFLKSDDRSPMWEQDYMARLGPAKTETRNMLQSRYQLTPMEVPAVPTVQR